MFFTAIIVILYPLFCYVTHVLSAIIFVLFSLFCYVFMFLLLSWHVVLSLSVMWCAVRPSCDVK